jgi:hypothetical protein
MCPEGHIGHGPHLDREVVHKFLCHFMEWSTWDRLKAVPTSCPIYVHYTYYCIPYSNRPI